jgi:hypothetical protein
VNALPDKPSAPRPAPPKQDAGYPEFINAMREWSDPNSPIWKTWACGHPRRVRQERQPWEKCLPCANSDKRARKYIAGHIALILIQLALAFVTVGGCK